jgi:hypothetical protein
MNAREFRCLARNVRNEIRKLAYGENNLLGEKFKVGNEGAPFL